MPRLNLPEDEARGLILSHAEQLFSEIGFAKTTVLDIAAASGVSPALVHKHFGTKSHIRQEMADRMLSLKLEAARRAVAQERTAADKFRALVMCLHTRTLESFRAKTKVFDMLAAAAEEKWEAVRRYRVAVLRLQEEIIRQGVADGEFQVEDPAKAAQATHMALSRLIHPLNVVEMLGEPDAGSAELLVDFLLQGLIGARETVTS